MILSSKRRKFSKNESKNKSDLEGKRIRIHLGLFALGHRVLLGDNTYPQGRCLVVGPEAIHKAHKLTISRKIIQFPIPD
jgi:hypothetical protein